MNEIKSIWDGWEKQFRFPADGPMIGGSEDDGFHCALTWADRHNALPIPLRITERIREAHPETAMMTEGRLIAYANNILGLTPEDFRRIDRETQIEEALKSVERVSQVTPDPALTPAIQRGGE